MLTIRTPEGSFRQLCRHDPPLRLKKKNNNNALITQLPADAIRKILLFLEFQSQDWLSADSCCASWREAARPLWQGQRAATAAKLAASRRAKTGWTKLHGFLPHAQFLRGPATQAELERLKAAVQPWHIPPILEASLLIHNGEIDTGLFQRGMYLGSRLLTTQEIIVTCQAWRKQAEEIQAQPTPASILNTTASGTLRIPLFSEAGARQVAMKLHTSDRQQQHGRIVFIGSVTPFAPHYKVLAGSWDGFLTLI